MQSNTTTANMISTCNAMAEVSNSEHQQQSSEQLEAPLTAKKTSMDISTLIRNLGAGAILAALYSFLMGGWDSGSDLTRYGIFLLQTLAFTGLGLGLGYFLHAARSARVFLLLSLVSVVVNFALLGAFIYSVSPQAAGLDIPAMVTWSVNTPKTAWLTTMLASCLLLPVAYIALRGLVRGISKPMLSLFVLTNLVLLMPLRADTWVAAIVLALGLAIAFFSTQLLQKRIEAKTSEGLLVLIIQLLPLSVLLGRSLWLHSSSVLLMVLSVILFAYVARQLWWLYRHNSVAKAILELMSILAAFANTLLIIAMLMDWSFVTSSVAIMVGALVGAIQIMEIGYRPSVNTLGYRRVAVVIVTLAAATNMLLQLDNWTALITFITGVLMLALSFKRQQTSMLIAGIGLMGFSIFEQIMHLLHAFDMGYVFGLTLVGVVAILVASIMESSSGPLRHWWVTCKRQSKRWQF